MSFLIFNLTLLSFVATNPKTPENLVWRYRVLIIQSTDLDSIWFQENLRQDLKDRKLLVFQFQGETLLNTNFNEKIDSNKFLEKLKSSSESDYHWVLIGLDGGIKKSGIGKIALPQEIFKIIDSMPMRQLEIRSGSN